MQGTQVQSLGLEDPLEKEMAAHSDILAWEISWTGEPVRLQSMGLQSVGHDWVTNTRIHIHWIFIGRTDAEAEALILCPPEAKSFSFSIIPSKEIIGKDPDAGKDWGQEEKQGAGAGRMTEDNMVGWHHRLNGHEFKQTPGDGEGQGTLVCCSSCGCKESHLT